MSLVIYIKIGSHKVRSRVVARLGKPGPSPIHAVPEGKDKGENKDIEYSEDEKVTLPKARKPTHPLSPRIVSVNHRTRREDNPTYPSLSGPQLDELFGIRDGGMGLQPPP